ncbi:putative Chaperone J-domain superfamily [Helianthus anomalus]
MTRQEAALSLGVSPTAGKVREAHRRVMVANHPDAGGNHYLDSYINRRIMVANHPDVGGNHYLASYQRCNAWKDEERWICILICF